MTSFIGNIEDITLSNDQYRKVLYTGHYSQLVVMRLRPGEEIGEEVHGLDQFIRIEQGSGQAILDGVTHDIGDNWAMVIPAGTRHNVINTSTDIDLKLYTVYAPPAHLRDTVQATKADEVEDHFDGQVSA